ncbi:MAG: phosphate/phosphite/phosphonate ABC transporter substrate-binding protein [Gammaproteobacteria bacterium]
MLITFKFTARLLCLFTLVSNTWQIAQAQDQARVQEQQEYSFGVVPQFEQRKLFRIWQPILLELEKYTKLKFHLKGSAKIPDFEKEFLAGHYDFAYMNPYHILAANNKQGYIPLIRGSGKPLYGVLVVKKDSNIKKLQDLDGKTIAFPAPNALGASLLIRADLKKHHHLDFKPKYVKTHSSVYLNVALGLTDAGGGVASTLDEQKDEIKDQLNVLYETRHMAPHPLSVHPRVAKDVQDKVKQAILKMAETEHGRALLEKVPLRNAISADISHYQELKSWGLKEFWVE